MLSHQRKAIFAKPCPFCGSTNIITEKKAIFYRSENRCCTYMKCDECDAMIFGDPVRDEHGELVTGYNSAQHAALTAWNRRSA